MRRQETRLADLEAAFPAGPPLDIEAAHEYIRLKVSAYCAVWATIPEEYRRVISADLDAGDAAFSEGGTHTYSRLTAFFWERVTETARKSILPQAMPGPLCQAILDFDDLIWIHECADCRASMPIRQVTFNPPSNHPPVFENCPICGGIVGYGAYSQKHKAGALSTITQYQGFYHEFLRLEAAADAVIDELGLAWLKATMSEMEEAII